MSTNFHTLFTGKAIFKRDQFASIKNLASNPVDVDVLICLLINTRAPSHWLKSVHDQLALSLNLEIFRTGKGIVGYT